MRPPYGPGSGWSATRLTRIAVVIPDLDAVRDVAERIFGEELRPLPAWAQPVTRAPFHISAGRPLAREPIVRAALLLLKLRRERLSMADAGALLRSPYLPGWDDEADARALLEVELRRRRQRHVLVPDLKAGLGPSIDSFRAVWRRIPGEQLPSRWRDSIVAALEAAGWPGDRVLSSAEYQTREAFLRLLDEFAALDVAAGVLDADDACDRLSDMAEETPFTIEDEGAPIQVMGVLEAAGSQFDALWITGLHDGAWPQAAHPNPFLPVALQRELRMPHSSPEREYEFSRMALRRLLSAAPAVVLSWPQREGDTAYRPSPLLPDVPDWTMRRGQPVGSVPRSARTRWKTCWTRPLRRFPRPKRWAARASSKTRPRVRSAPSRSAVWVRSRSKGRSPASRPPSAALSCTMLSISSGGKPKPTPA